MFNQNWGNPLQHASACYVTTMFVKKPFPSLEMALRIDIPIFKEQNIAGISWDIDSLPPTAQNPPPGQSHMQLLSVSRLGISDLWRAHTRGALKPKRLSIIATLR